ncbi:MAG TPA: response regulator transcription factor [Candidatus Sulfotelmatobacter sp.]|nr:response regulator transcription factor [Candidatus Sulfotelmatobacter sp.]
MHQTIAGWRAAQRPQVFLVPARILIADDNPVVRQTLRKLLEAAGQWEIIEAATGEEAVAKSLESRPELLILDLVMPVMDGLTAAKEISRVLPGAKMLMYTMHQSSHLEREALKFGVRKVVSKTESSLLVEAARQLLTEVPAETSSDPIQPLETTSPTIAADGVASIGPESASQSPSEPGEIPPSLLGKK